MSTYAVHTDRRELLAMWGEGIGAVAHTVAYDVDPEKGRQLADALTSLAAAAWHSYTHPASGANEHGDNSEGWRREQERAAFDAALAALTNPHLPSNGAILASYSRVTETAHRVGRVLHDLADPALAKAVVADLEAELAAVDAAERGDLLGRARQAVGLTRLDASPLQVAAADALLREDPFGTTALLTDVEPTAAAIAAAHWFLAAVAVAADAANLDDVTEVIDIADAIQAVPTRTLREVLRLGELDASPRPIVLALIEEAMLVANGYHPGESDESFSDDADGDDEGDDTGETGERRRLCVLDPARPAHDLLEDLLTGINAAWLVYGDNFDDSDSPSDGEEDEQADEVFRTAYTETFVDALRTRAQESHDRLA